MMSFLPHEVTLNHVLLFGLFLLIGLVGGSLAHRSGWLPKITGYMAVGLLFGPGGLGLLTGDMVHSAQIFVSLALGMILFDLGRQLNLRDLLHMRGLRVSSAAEMAGGFALVAGGLWLLGLPLVAALLMAAVGMSGSPAIAMMVVREFDAKGPVTERSLSLLALNNIGAFAVFTLLLPLMYQVRGASWLTVVFHPIYLLLGSIAVAYVLYWLGRVMLDWLHVDRERQAFALVVALLLLGIGLSDVMGLSSLLTSLLLGTFVATLREADPLQEARFGEEGDVFFIILFVVAGAGLHLADVFHAGPLALAFVLLRSLGKWAGLQAVAHKTKLDRKQLTAVSGMLVPMAGLAIGLSQTTEAYFPMLGATLVPLILAGVAILETIGPVVSELALRWCGEMDGKAKLDH